MTVFANQELFGVSVQVKKGLVVNVHKLPGMGFETVSVSTDTFRLEGQKNHVKIFEHDEFQPAQYWIAHECRPYQWDWEVKISKQAAMELKKHLKFIPCLNNQ